MERPAPKPSRSSVPRFTELFVSAVFVVLIHLVIVLLGMESIRSFEESEQTEAVKTIAISVTPESAAVKQP
jgi:hypothetical protein